MNASAIVVLDLSYSLQIGAISCETEIGISGNFSLSLEAKSFSWVMFKYEKSRQIASDS